MVFVNLFFFIMLTALARENRLFRPCVFNMIAALGLGSPNGHEVAVQFL
jgi:hypothetical protein